MTVLPLITIAAGLALPPAPASAPQVAAARARLDRLVASAAPAVAARGIREALAAGARHSAGAAVDPRPIVGDRARRARERLDALVDASASGLLHRAVAESLAEDTDRLIRASAAAIARHGLVPASASEVAVVGAAPRPTSPEPSSTP